MRPDNMMSDDLVRVGQTAPLGGYVQFEGYLGQATNLLRRRDYAAMGQSLAALIGLFQGQVTGPERMVQVSALALGIVLGWQQQGTWMGSRGLSESFEALDYVVLHPRNARFTGYEPLVERARSKLRATRDVHSIATKLKDLIEFLQNQSVGPAKRRARTGLLECRLAPRKAKTGGP